MQFLMQCGIGAKIKQKKLRRVVFSREKKTEDIEADVDCNSSLVGGRSAISSSILSAKALSNLKAHAFSQYRTNKRRFSGPKNIGRRNNCFANVYVSETIWCRNLPVAISIPLSRVQSREFCWEPIVISRRKEGRMNKNMFKEGRKEGWMTSTGPSRKTDCQPPDVARFRRGNNLNVRKCQTAKSVLFDDWTTIVANVRLLFSEQIHFSNVETFFIA